MYTIYRHGNKLNITVSIEESIYTVLPNIDQNNAMNNPLGLILPTNLPI